MKQENVIITNKCNGLIDNNNKNSDINKIQSSHISKASSKNNNKIDSINAVNKRKNNNIVNNNNNKSSHNELISDIEILKNLERRKLYAEYLFKKKEYLNRTLLMNNYNKWISNITNNRIKKLYSDYEANLIKIIKQIIAKKMNDISFNNLGCIVKTRTSDNEFLIDQLKFHHKNKKVKYHSTIIHPKEVNLKTISQNNSKNTSTSNLLNNNNITYNSNNNTIIIIENYKYDKSLSIGNGAFSSVFTCFDENGKNYAMKHITKANLKNAVFFEQVCKNEIEMLKSLNSKYIVKVYEILESSEDVFIIMEKLDCSLLLLLKIKSFSETQCFYLLWKFIRSIILALEYCHEEVKIVHSDIHPKNILLSKDLNSAKLTDFGLSSKLQENIDLEDANKNLMFGYLNPPYFNEFRQKINEERRECKNDLEELNKINNAEFEFKKATDFWMLGVSIYWIIYGDPKPFYNGKNELNE